MKIEYTFQTNEKTVIEVDENLGNVILEFRDLEAKNERRETRRHTSLQTFDYEDYHFGIDTTERDTLALSVRECIKTLQPEQQELLHRYFWEDKTLTQIAAEDGISVQAVRKRLNKIYRLLENKLK